MSSRDLFRDPVWQGSELGQPIPDSVHAVSMALPRWQDVVGYEEKKPEVVSNLASGYPRFVIHPLVQQLAHRLAGDQPCLPFPSARTAALGAEFVRRISGAPAEVVPAEGKLPLPMDVRGVVTNETGYASLRAFWQHTGLIVSSRQAEAMLAARQSDVADDEVRRSLRKQLAGFYDCSEDDVFLTPSGMAAQYSGLRAVMQRSPGHATAQLGFPYVDTLKLQQKIGVGGILLHDLDRLADDLHALIHQRDLAACFCEIPGNPLLGSADLRRIQPLLRENSVPLVADDVVAKPFNVDLSRHADLIASSLTKYIVGTGDAMGGALICNPRSPFYAELKAIIRSQHEELLWGEEAAVFDKQARGFPE